MDESFDWIQKMIITFNSVFMLIHQVRISEALEDLRDRLGRRR
jgi:hypothetical protein